MSREQPLPGLRLFGSEPVSPRSLRDEPDWVLVERITGQKCPESVDLRALSRMTGAERMKTLGLTETQAKRLGSALALGERLANEPVLRNQTIRSGEAVFRVLKGSAKDARKEGFYAFTLDQKHRLIDIHRISEGTLTMTPVHPREAFHPVLRDSAAAVIFVHNHPSGDPEPSPDDWALTRRLVECGKLLGIRVLDHVVAGNEHFDTPFVSLRDRGMMDEDGISQVAEPYGAGFSEKKDFWPLPERLPKPGPKSGPLPAREKSGGGKRSPESRTIRERDDARGR